MGVTLSNYYGYCRADSKITAVKTVGQTSVMVGDVGDAKDGAQIQTNLVRVDGQRSA